MSESYRKPIIFVDVDGPLNPWKNLPNKNNIAANKAKRFIAPKGVPTKADKFAWEWFEATATDGITYSVLLAPDTAPYWARIHEVFTVVWCTTWEDAANTEIGPRVGIKNSPVLYFPGDCNDANGPAHQWAKLYGHRGSWKTRWVAKWIDDFGVYKNADGEFVRRPWVWVDDDVNGHDTKHFNSHWDDNAPDFWVNHIEPHRGLTAEDFENIIEWGKNRTD